MDQCGHGRCITYGERVENLPHRLQGMVPLLERKTAMPELSHLASFVSSLLKNGTKKRSKSLGHYQGTSVVRSSSSVFVYPMKLSEPILEDFSFWLFFCVIWHSLDLLYVRRLESLSSCLVKVYFKDEF